MRNLTSLAIVLVTIVSCSLPSVAKSAGPLISGVPHIQQKPDFCGEACAAMYLQKLGKKVSQDDIYDLSGLDPLKGRGCYTPELVKSLKKIGFQVGPVWNKVKVKNIDQEMEGQWKALVSDLAKGIPSIVCTYYSARPNSTEHFRLILGYDKSKDEVIYHEPAVAKGAYQRMTKKTFLKIWPLKYERKQWLVIRIRLAGKKSSLTVKKPATTSRFTDADYAQHIRKLKKRLPHKNFHIVVERPFVVVGDESPARVKYRSKNTVRWAVKHLKKLYFKKDPLKIIDVWLFKNKKSYRTNAKLLFNHTPSTPYGYYSRSKRALVMNISTGGGTLVHEIVHPFMEANFSRCPAWFNEGLASLYEQCGTRKGQIHGYTNWRLAGLQRAIKRGKVPSFQDLTSTNTHEFYNRDPGTNYSQGRYLCYYLQSRGLLVKYYHQFVKDSKSDPTGYKTLQSVLGEKDMDAFKDRWEKYVLKLRYR